MTILPHNHYYILLAIPFHDDTNIISHLCYNEDARTDTSITTIPAPVKQIHGDLNLHQHIDFPTILSSGHNIDSNLVI